MKQILTIFLLFSIIMPAMAETRTVVTRTPINNYHRYIPHHNRHFSNNNYFSDLNELEKYTFDKNFPRESTLQRLQRLENQAFGAVQSGDITSRYANVREAILSHPKQNQKLSLLRGLGNYFSGQMTGFTPSLNNSYYPQNNPYSNFGNNFSFSQYPSNFGNSYVSEFNNGPFSRGHHIHNFSTGSNAGVRIID